MFKNKLEFPGGGGGGVQDKNPSMGGVWILSGTAHSDNQFSLVRQKHNAGGAGSGAWTRGSMIA